MHVLRRRPIVAPIVFVIVAMGAMVGGPEAAFARTCPAADTLATVSGKLSRLPWTHPSQGAQVAYIVRATRTVCVNDGGENWGPTRDVQVSLKTQSEYSRLRALVGKKVVVTGSLAAGTTIWYQTDVALLEATFK